MKKKAFIYSIIITVCYLLLHFFLIKDYALSWDYHYHHYGGLYHLGLEVPRVTDKPAVPFGSPDPRLTFKDPFGPFTQMVPSLSQTIFYDRLKVLPLDISYNLPMVIFGSLGVGVLFYFLYLEFNILVAFFASFSLGFLPTYFGYLHNNMKDIPNALFFALSIFLFYRLLKKRSIKNLLVASFAFAVSFNIKVNSLQIPAICFLFFVLSKFEVIIEIFKGKMRKVIKDKYHLIFLYFLLAPLMAVLLWIPFWEEPFAKLFEIPYFYSHNTLMMPILMFGKLYYSGLNVPWFYPYVYIFITTPLPILISFLAGLFICFYKIRTKNKLYLLLIIWFFVPLLRYWIPKMGAIDGVRHFMEVVYPLSAISGIGLFYIFAKIKKITKENLFAYILLAFTFVSVIYNNIKFHPYQTSYFNILIGGIKGASERFDIDFWATPQIEAVKWLNKNAPKNAIVNVIMGQCTAGLYFRQDLLENLNKKPFDKSDYVVILNRPSFILTKKEHIFLKEKSKAGKVVYTREVDNVPLVWVIQNF